MALRANPAQVAELIKFHRQKAALDSVTLAEEAGTTVEVIERLEAGDGTVSLVQLSRVLEALNLGLFIDGPLGDLEAHGEGMDPANLALADGAIGEAPSARNTP